MRKSLDNNVLFILFIQKFIIAEIRLLDIHFDQKIEIASMHNAMLCPFIAKLNI